MKQIRFFLPILLALLVSGCGTMKVNALNTLVGQSWELSSLLGNGIDPGKFSAGIPTLNFLAGGNLAGFAGCNSFSGEFSLEGTAVTLDPGAITKKACPGTGEDEFLAAIGKVTSLKIEKEKLILIGGTTELMSFISKKD